MYTQMMGQVKGRVMVSVQPEDGSGKGKGDGECTPR